MTVSSGKPLRIARCTRVSTEEQEAQGESLNVQRRQIEAAVAQLGGTITAFYDGQEHAMPGYERKKFERMLADAPKGIFDAVCVADSSRWSRDNTASKRAIAIFRTHGIRFFCLTREYDLHDPQCLFTMGVLSEAHELVVALNLRKSAQSRIERAKEGFVTSGIPPYGRKVVGEHPDGTAKWDIDPEAQKAVSIAAKLYLAGRTWDQVGKFLGDEPETVRRRVFAAGSDWKQTFKSDGKRISVPCKVPPLLPDDTIRAVRRKSEAHHINRRTPNVYPLSRYLRCDECGSVLSVHTHKSGLVWVQHHSKTKGKGCFTGAKYLRIEDSFLGEVGQALKRTTTIRQAVEEAVTQSKPEQADLEANLEHANARLDRIVRKRSNFVANLGAVKIQSGSATARQVIAEVRQLDEDFLAVSTEIAEVKAKLTRVELPIDLDERIERTVRTLVSLNGWAILKWPADKQRALVQFLFGSRSLKGRDGSGSLRHKDGVFLRKPLPDGTISWVAHGWFGLLGGAVTDFVELEDRYADTYERIEFPLEALRQIAQIPGDYTIPQVGKRWSASACP